MIPRDLELQGWPGGGNFRPFEVFSSRDEWIDPEQAYLLNRGRILRALAGLEITRRILTFWAGEEVAIRIYRWLVSPEYNEQTYKAIGRPMPERPTQHYRGWAVDPVAFKKDLMQRIPDRVTAGALDAAGFQRVAIVKNAQGRPIGSHADYRPGPRVTSGFNSLYPGAVKQEWYPTLIKKQS